MFFAFYFIFLSGFFLLFCTAVVRFSLVIIICHCSSTLSVAVCIWQDTWMKAASTQIQYSVCSKIASQRPSFYIFFCLTAVPYRRINDWFNYTIMIWNAYSPMCKSINFDSIRRFSWSHISMWLCSLYSLPLWHIHQLICFNSIVLFHSPGVYMPCHGKHVAYTLCCVAHIWLFSISLIVK